MSHMPPSFRFRQGWRAGGALYSGVGEALAPLLPRTSSLKVFDFCEHTVLPLLLQSPSSSHLTPVLQAAKLTCMQEYVGMLLPPRPSNPSDPLTRSAFPFEVPEQASSGSILLVGRPGVRKTTLLRDVTRILADDLSLAVVVVDTSNEIAGGWGGLVGGWALEVLGAGSSELRSCSSAFKRVGCCGQQALLSGGNSSAERGAPHPGMLTCCSSAPGPGPSIMPQVLPPGLPTSAADLAACFVGCCSLAARRPSTRGPGDSTVAHPCIGAARRFQVPTRDMQHKVGLHMDFAETEI